MPCKPLKSAAQALIALLVLLGVLTAKSFACRGLYACRVTRQSPSYGQEIRFESRLGLGFSYSVCTCLIYEAGSLGPFADDVQMGKQPFNDQAVRCKRSAA